MGEIRIVGPGKTREYPYPVCKKYFSHMNLMLKICSLMLLPALIPACSSAIMSSAYFQDDFQNDFAQMTNEADSSVVSAEL